MNSSCHFYEVYCMLTYVCTNFHKCSMKSIVLGISQTNHFFSIHSPQLSIRDNACLLWKARSIQLTDCTVILEERNVFTALFPFLKGGHHRHNIYCSCSFCCTQLYSVAPFNEYKALHMLYCNKMFKGAIFIFFE
jgi:hypothetical protein